MIFGNWGGSSVISSDTSLDDGSIWCRVGMGLAWQGRKYQLGTLKRVV